MEAHDFGIFDFVYKKSRKPFQSGKRVEQIIKITTMNIPNRGLVLAVMLTNCSSPVELRIIRKDKEGLEVMISRDLILGS